MIVQHPIQVKELEAIKDLIVAARHYAHLNKFFELEKKLCDVLVDAVTTIEEAKGHINFQHATPPPDRLYHKREVIPR